MHDITACIKAEQELQVLRAWKEKARPFLEGAKERYQDKLDGTRISNFYNDNAKGVLINKYNSQIRILTELLGGSDER